MLDGLMVFERKTFMKFCKRTISVQFILIKKFCLEPKTLLSSKAWILLEQGGLSLSWNSIFFVVLSKSYYIFYLKLSYDVVIVILF